MTTGPGTPPDPAALLRDWMTLVQTELAGLATDREVLETWQALWAKAAGGGRHDPPGAAAAVVAPGAGQFADRDALLARIDALERRIAVLERAAGKPSARPRSGRSG